MVRSKQEHRTPQNQLHSHESPIAPAEDKRPRQCQNDGIKIKSANNRHTQLSSAHDTAEPSHLTKTTPRPANPARKLDILLHDGHALRVDGAQIRVFEQVDQECLRCFLECLDGVRLPAELGAAFCGEEVECDFADEAGEGEFLDEEVVGALVAADFFQGYRAGLVAAAAALGGWITGWMDLLVRGSGIWEYSCWKTRARKLECGARIETYVEHLMASCQLDALPPSRPL